MEPIIVLLVVAIFASLFIGIWLGFRFGGFKMNRRWEREVPNLRKDAVLRSRAVLAGQFSEQLAPYMPGFSYSPTECKFLGKPVDFLVFRGMDEKEIEEVVFVEVKSGKSKLNKQEKNLKEAIEKKRVRWEEYRVD